MKKVLSEKYRARAKAELGELKTPQSQLEKPSIGVNGPAAEGGVATFNVKNNEHQRGVMKEGKHYYQGHLRKKTVLLVSDLARRTFHNIYIYSIIFHNIYNIYIYILQS